MPDAIITSTESTFGTISGTFAADQSTITGTVTGIVAGTLSGSVGVPGPAGPGVPAGGTAGQYLQKIDGVDYNTDWVTLNLSAYAPLNSPAFTGNPTAPTAALGDNDTSLATTAFVQQELASGTAVAKNLEVYVRNQTGSTLAAGAIVYINGATGNRPTVTLAQANNDANSAQTFGFVKTAIANNGFGYVIVRGECENLDTSALTEGAQLYLSPTTAGAWTTTKPSAPEHLVYVGIVVRSHPTQGVILVAVQNGYELNELHDVQISSPTNGQVLKYNASTGLWYNGTDVGGVAWGGITGTLSAQTDLQTALNLKLDSSTAASTYRALSNNTFGNMGITAGNALTIDDGGSPIGETVLQNSGLLIRDTSNVPLARFQYDQVLLPSVGLTFADATTQTTAGLSPATAASTYQTIAGMSSYLTTATAASTYQTIAGMSSYLTTASAASTYAPLAGATFTGLVSTLAPTTATAGLRLPHGTAPTTPVNGDLFTTTSGLFARINGTTRQYVDLDGTQTINGAKTFSNANQTIGNSTAAGTIAIGTGATISGSTRTINIGTASAAGSTNNINIGGGSGTSTTTLNGTTNGVTVAADTNSTAIATTAFVVGQAGSATPLVNGTAAVGTSLRYARQDHVHPTDTTRAALAGATFTGLVSTPASAVGSAGFRLVPGVAPSTPTNGDLWATTNDMQVRLNGVTETIAEQSWVTAQGYITSSALSPYLLSSTAASTYAPLASPALTGTPTAPTATAGTSTTQIATTAFVTTADNLKANLASPTFTGTPAAPTAAAGTNTTQIATTAFVRADNNAKVWVNFNGTGTIAIRTSFNVSSITDVGVGTYTVNFTNAISADAVGVGMVSDDGVNYRGINLQGGIANLTTTSYKINTWASGGGGQTDPTVVQLAIFR